MPFWTRQPPSEERALEMPDVYGEAIPSRLDTLSAKGLSETRALQMIAVWSCVSIIADNVASLTLEQFNASKSSAPLPSPPWIEKPNDEMTPIDFWHRVLSSLLLNGNAYIFYSMGSTTLQALYPIHPSLVNVTRRRGRLVYGIGGKEYDSSSIIHIRAFTVAGSDVGLSPIEYARQAIGLGLTAEEFGARFFDQGITMSGVIETPKDLTEAQARILAKTFGDMHTGTKKAHLPGVITNGGAWKQLSITPEQAQFLETRRFQKQEIAALFRVPAYLLDPSVQSSWGTGIQEQNRAFVQYTLTPWLGRIEQAISAALNPRALKVKFSTKALLRGSTLERYQAYALGLTNKWLTVNEVRAEEGLEPLPEKEAPPPPPAADDPADDGDPPNEGLE